MVPDYHIHTPFCKHAEGEIEEYVEAARQKNLKEICFTDHVPNPDNYDPKNRMDIKQFAAYQNKVAAVASQGGLSVLFGTEADYYEGCEKFLKEWLPRQKLDLVIGSIHYINSWGFDNPEEREVWDNVDVANTWQVYFDLADRLVDTELFDVIGHFDLPKKFGYSPAERAIEKMVQPILKKIARVKMTIEINTSGLRKPVGEIYPSPMLLKMARAHGIPICFGSDAHKPGEVGYEFAAALELAKSAGYSEAVRFSGRQKTSYALPDHKHMLKP